jgi:alkaline phosphatase
MLRARLVMIHLGLAALALPVATPALAGERPVFPRNVILMISDGCGYNHVAAASLFEFGRTGAEIYESFPVRCGVSTYSLDGEPYEPARAWSSFEQVLSRPTDSAAAITALGTGIKTHNGVLGLDGEGRPLLTFLQQAETTGRATGVVTSVEFCHATPAGLVVANPDRHDYRQIARAMILDSPLEVIMGAGHPLHDDDGQPVDRPRYRYVGGQDVWQAVQTGRAGADCDGDGVADPWTLVDTRDGFRSLVEGPVPRRVLGVAPVRETLQQARSGDRLADPFVVPLLASSPTLREMSLGALRVLAQDPDGFVVMIEGGAVDWASHDSEAGRMIEEQIDFNEAVRGVVAWIEANSSWDETLLVVTADHECGYLLGPGSGDRRGEPPSWQPLANRGRGHLPGLEWHSGGHSSSLVPMYAQGPGSENLQALAGRTDPRHGPFLDNCDIGRTLLQLVAGRASPAPAVGCP